MYQNPSELEAIEKRDAAIVAMRREGKLSLKKIGAAQVPQMSGERIRQILELREPGLSGKSKPATTVYKPGRKLANGVEVIERLSGDGERPRCKFRCHCGREFTANALAIVQCRRCNLAKLRRVPLEKIVKARAAGWSYKQIMKKYKYKSTESVRRAIRQGEREAKQLAVDEAFS